MHAKRRFGPFGLAVVVASLAPWGCERVTPPPPESPAPPTYASAAPPPDPEPARLPAALTEPPPADPGVPKQHSIVVADTPIALEPGVPVVRFDQPGGLSFYAAQQTRADPEPRLFTARRRMGKSTSPDDPRAFRAWSPRVRAFVLHGDSAADSAAGFAALVDQNQSTHFLIDWDGTVYQALDPRDQARHAGSLDDRSIGIHLSGLLPDLTTTPDAPAWPTQHPRRSQMGQGPFKRVPSTPMTYQLRSAPGPTNVTVASYGFTQAQYRSLASLLRALLGVFPWVRPQFPLDDDGRILTRSDHPGPYIVGLVPAWYVFPDRWDPGPGLDWLRLQRSLIYAHDWSAPPHP